MNPWKVSLRAYNVGFGDCSLLTFHYAHESKRILIDFGSTKPPAGVPANFMQRIARDIATGGSLDAVVATHRHNDHISGFGSNSGKIVASLKPQVVVQPWTEDPQAARDGFGRCDQSETCTPNSSAVRNLMEMARKGHAAYVHSGSPSGLDPLLPGVEILVLGPPTLEQSAAIHWERRCDPKEFWQFRAFWEGRAEACKAGDLFPHADRYSPGETPPNLRWFLARAQAIRKAQTKNFVRILDRVLNNTSVILLFRIGDFSLLFPGDAQIESWSWSLGQKRYRELLAGVRVYKVGHHGSRNGTPRSLWNLFLHRSRDSESSRLLSILSTRPGTHGSEPAHTEVPRRTLVETLERESNLFCTQNLAKTQMYREFEFIL